MTNCCLCCSPSSFAIVACCFSSRRLSCLSSRSLATLRAVRLRLLALAAGQLDALRLDRRDLALELLDAVLRRLARLEERLAARAAS